MKCKGRRKYALWPRRVLSALIESSQAAASICVDGLSAPPPPPPVVPISLSRREFAGLFTWINRSIKRVHTIPPSPRRRRSATCINNFADTWRINRARAFPRNLFRHSSENATWICYDASWPMRLYRSNYRAFFHGYLFATRYAGTIKLLVAGNMISRRWYVAVGFTNEQMVIVDIGYMNK